MADALGWASALSMILYAAIAMPHLALQARFAAASTRRSPRARSTARDLPSVDVIVPCYNEDRAVLAACLHALAVQDFGGRMQVYVVDDGSQNRVELNAVYEAHRTLGVEVLRLAHNGGKRRAQVVAIRVSDGELVVTVDSDTVLDPGAVRALVDAMSDPATGAAMGQVVASNAGASWLSRLIHLRYWFACNQERAAQSYFGAVLCCCGPCAIFRRSVLTQVIDDFAGAGRGHGEDRHLTSLVLGTGMGTRYAPDAHAWTVVPEHVGPFLHQQLRWNRSTYREMARVAPVAARIHPYLALDVVAQVVGPLLLATSVLSAAGAALAGAVPPQWYAAATATLGLLHCAYGTWRTRRPAFLAFLAYGLVHIGLTLSVRPYALLTLGSTGWGTRQQPPTALEEQMALPGFRTVGPALSQRHRPPLQQQPTADQIGE